MSAVVIDGKPVHYEVFGRGRPVLFLHGWLGSWRYWVPVMESISDKHRAYALDFWGFGESYKSKPNYRVSDYVLLVNTFLDSLGIENSTVVGHALGASVALEYAIWYPERVSKLMLVSLPLTPESLSRKLIGFAKNSRIAQVIWRRHMPQMVQQEVEKTDQAAISESLQSMTRMDAYSRLHYLGQLQRTAVLVVFGERDDMVDPDPVRSLNGYWTNVRPIGLPDSKHFPMLDEPAKFSRLLKDFLEMEGDLSALELKEEWRRRTR